jgi:predicted HicB family RNase H-like nuclease
MNTKLTLNIDQNVIEEAKTYAKKNSVSLSKLIENYLFSLTKKNNPAKGQLVAKSPSISR